MPPQYHCVDVNQGTFELKGNKGSKSRRVENPCHAHDTVLGQTGNLLGDVNHRVQWIRNNDDKRIGRVLDDLLGHHLDDFSVGPQQVASILPRLARNTGGDDHDVGISGILIIVGTRNDAVKHLQAPGLLEVQSFALG